MFDDVEKRWLRTLAPHLAEGARRSLLVGEATDPEGSQSPGLLVLADDRTIESSTPMLGSGFTTSPTATSTPGACPRRS